MKIKLIVLTIFIISSTIYSQSFEIVKIIDNNLFVLENGKQVRFFGLYIPSLNDADSSVKEISNEIFKWEESFLLDRDFNFNFMGQDDNGVLEAIIIKEHAFYDENMAEKLLSNGYAALLSSNDEAFNSSLTKYQNRAKEANYGMWNRKILINENIVKSNLSEINNIPYYAVTYERPYLPFLGLSVASFALAIDNFASASDIQDQIDVLKEFSEDADVGSLKSSKSRKTIVGVTCLVAGVITTFYSFKKVEVRIDLQSISLSYTF